MSAHADGSRIDLNGHVALVTGGGDGLGRAFALALAKAGARVAITGRRAQPLAETVELIERSGGKALALPGDVTAPDAVRLVVRTVESQLGPIDLLVNNAGMVGPLGHDWEVDPDDSWRTFEVNVLGAFRCAREVLAGMVARKRGRIVNISSAAGFGRIPQMNAYGATKAAMTQWTKTLAEDTRPHGIAVFALHPGFVRSTSIGTSMTSPEVPRVVRETFRAMLEQGRDTPIERAAEMLLFLASGGADALSGRFIRAKDDDAAALVQRTEEIRKNDLHTVTLRT